MIVVQLPRDQKDLIIIAASVLKGEIINDTKLSAQTRNSS